MSLQISIFVIILKRSMVIWRKPFKNTLNTVLWGFTEILVRVQGIRGRFWILWGRSPLAKAERSNSKKGSMCQRGSRLFLDGRGVERPKSNRHWTNIKGDNLTRMLDVSAYKNWELVLYTTVFHT
jgi:hypothetical protein